MECSHTFPLIRVIRQEWRSWDWVVTHFDFSGLNFRLTPRPILAIIDA